MMHWVPKPACRLAMSICWGILALCAVTEASAQAIRRQAADWQSIFPKDRITQPIDSRATRPLPGSVHRLARVESDAGAAAGDTAIPGMILALNRGADQQAVLDALSEAQQDPSSPLFHRWLTPEEFGAHFGLSRNDLDKVSAWLRAEGFTIDEIPAGRWMIIFSGTASNVEKAFQVTMRQYRIDGKLYISNSNDPRIPAALDGIVQGIAGLHNFPPVPAGGSTGNAIGNAVTSTGAHFMDPSDFATIYGLNSLYAAGIKGTGVNLAVIAPCGAFNDVQPAAAAFWNLERISSQGFWWVYYAGTPRTCSTAETGEAVLDYEWAGAVAPGATIWLGTSGSQDPLLGAATGLVNSGLKGIQGITNTTVGVISMSYQSCESPSYHSTWVSLWQQAHNSGLTSLVSSGDGGAAGCDYPPSNPTATHGFAINGYCASPYVVCVGGTQFDDTANPSAYWSSSGKALSYIPEEVWNESATNGGSGLWSGGGGYSTFVTKPSWQAGTASPNRGTPDVALSAAGHDGYRICPTSDNCNANFIYGAGGTSAATPSFAGIMALLIQQTGQLQGSVNQTMYNLAGMNLGAFHDIVRGNNSVPGQPGFSAVAGWDAASGLGSVNAASLLTNWAAGVPGAPVDALSSTNVTFPNQTVGISSPAASVTLTNSGTAPLTITSITVSGANPADFSETNTCPSSLAVSTLCTISVFFKPSATGTRSATLVITDNAAGSPHDVTLSGVGAQASPSPTASTYHLFPQIADGTFGDGSYFQSLMVVTSSSQTANPSCTVQFHGLSFNGQTQASFTFNGAYVYKTPGNQTAIQTGYASLQCSATVEAQVLYTWYTAAGAKISEATVFSSPAVTSAMIVADDRGGARMALAIANDSSQNGTYTISGGGAFSATVAVNAGQSKAFYIDQVASIPANYNGPVTITALSGTASVIGLRFTGNLFTTVPATAGANSPTSNTYHVFPQIADGLNGDGSYFQSTVMVSNAGLSTVNCTLQFHGLAINGQTQASFSAGSGSQGSAYFYSTPGTGHSLQTGYASLQCSQKVEAQLVYSWYTAAGSKISEATVFSSPSSTSLLRIYADYTGGARLGLAVANDSAGGGNYTIKVHDASGNVILTNTFSVAQGANKAVFLDELVNVPAGYSGLVDIIPASGSESVIGLRFTGNIFTTVPAVIVQ